METIIVPIHRDYYEREKAKKSFGYRVRAIRHAIKRLIAKGAK